MTDKPADWDGWKKAAIAITPSFETNGDPYVAVTGDFDRMGISCGALQWNIGKGSLQPMVLAVGQSTVMAAMPTFGRDFWTACNGDKATGLAMVRRWQSGGKVWPQPKAELRSLMGTPEMRAEQDKGIEKKATTALTAAVAWAASGQPAGVPSKRLFCWFFDLTTQNGDMEGVTRPQVLDFIKNYDANKTVCDYLANLEGASGHIFDARKNGVLWSGKASGETLELLTMSHLRAGTANPQWRHVVLNRKGTIAMGQGWVNSGYHDFRQHGL